MKEMKRNLLIIPTLQIICRCDIFASFCLAFSSFYLLREDDSKSCQKSEEITDRRERKKNLTSFSGPERTHEFVFATLSLKYISGFDFHFKFLFLIMQKIE
jgi:hypothetical protein